MRICIYNLTASLHYGGLETYAWLIGQALVDRGHQVDIMAGSGGRSRSERVRLIVFPFRDRSRFPDLGTRFRKLMERLSFARHAWRHLVAAPYDAVIINKPYDFPAIWWAKRRGFSAEVLYRSGGTEFYPGDRFFAKAVDQWVSTSAYNAQQVQGRYHRPVTVIHNGVDVEQFRPLGVDAAERARWGLPAQALVIMSVGRLVGWKGLQVIVDALPGLPEVHFAYVGEGPVGRKLQAQAERLAVAERVHALGERPHGDLPRLLSQADIFVQPSIGEEAFGITVVEAMACALPVLASNNGGIVEIVEEGQSGRLLPPGDVTAWRQAIGDLGADAELRRHMGRAGRRRAESRFTWAANAQRVEQLLEQGRSAQSKASSLERVPPSEG